MGTPPEDPPPVDPDNPTASGGAGVGQPPLTPPYAAIVSGPPPDPDPSPDVPDAA